jgi:hypothetical protein
VDPVSPPRHDGPGVPHHRRILAALPGSASAEEDWNGANDAKVEKLRRNQLQRLAGSRGLQLRQSAYGYALIDAAHRRIDDRGDLTLAEVEAWLDRG